MGDNAAGTADDEAWVEDDDSLVIEDPKRPLQHQDDAWSKAMFYFDNPWVLLLVGVATYFIYRNPDYVRHQATNTLFLILLGVGAYILYFNPIDGNYVSSVAQFYLGNPWFLLVVGVCAYLLYQRVVRPRLNDAGATYQTWQESRRAAAELNQQRQNPDSFRDRMEAMERARARQQAAHEAAAAEAAEKERVREELRRADKLKKLESLQNGKGYNNKSEKLATEYSPLMGNVGSSGACFRPARRGPAGGGGGG